MTVFDGVEAYPLSWPMMWQRTPPYKREVSLFANRSLASARDFVLSEVRRLNGRSVIISSNVELRLDGLPRSGRRAPDDPGVAVYFTLKGQPKVLACDKWTVVEDNLWAIGKHIEAIRGQQRWGVGTIDQAFMGYDALPAPADGWWEVLGVPVTAGIEVITEAYRQKVKTVHPDAGGSEEEFLRVQAAFEAAKKARGQ